MTEALSLAKLATSLQHKIDLAYRDKCADDDISAPVLDLILDAFGHVGDLVEERLKKEAQMNRGPG